MERDDPKRRWAALAGYALVVAYVVFRELGNSAYDDSYFFKRFALHAVEHGTYAWNLGDGPVHGSTSQLFQLVTTTVVLFTKTHFIAAVRVLDGVLLVAAAGVLLRVARGPLVLLTLGNALVLSAVRSNMETALALLVVSAALVHEVRAWSTPRRSDDLRSAAFTVLVYLARPDAAAIVGVVAVLRRGWTTRSFVTYGLALALAMGGVWLTLWSYYGTALPLSFHMKTMALHTYGPHIASKRWATKIPHVLVFAFTCAPMIWLLVRARVWRRTDATLALTVSAAVFVLYHGLATHEIMGYRARFYVPALVPLGLAASRVWPDTPVSWRAWGGFVAVWAGVAGVAYWQGWAPNARGFFLTTLPWPTYAMLVAGWSVALLWPRRPVGVVACLLLGTVAWIPLDDPKLRKDVDVLFRHNREVTTTRGIFDVARCLPPGSTVFHSEMGVPGLALYRMRVVDQVGLLSADVALRGLDFESRCNEERPEAVFLPHRNYRALNASIAESACFQRDYVRVVDESSSALHVRRDLFDGFLACGTEYREWRHAPSGGTGR